MTESHNALTIFLYHGVTGTESVGIENYSGKHCPNKEFVRQMRYIKDHCSVLTMDEVATHYKTQTPFPKNSAAITFDDAFRNVATVATPILTELQLPATFYLTTGFIGTKRMFWVDMLEDCINRTTCSEIAVPLGEETRTFLLTSIESRKDALQAIKSYCKNVSSQETNRIVEHIKEVAAIEPAVESSPNYEKLSWDEVVTLGKNPLWILGGHSVDHHILAALPVDVMQQEIEESISALSMRLGRPIFHYSYPEGGKQHYNDQVIAQLKKAGIICCPSAVDGVNTLDDDLFHLKRVMVGFMGRKFPYEHFS